MATQTINPTSPAAGLSVVSRPGLRIQAVSVTVSTGANWVAIDGVQSGAAIPPGVTGLVAMLAYGTMTPQITITAPPASQAPTGPPAQTTITFSDQPQAPQAGVLSTPQTVAAVELESTVLNIATGLARAFTSIIQTPQQSTVDISGNIADLPVGTLDYITQYTSAAGAVSFFSCGQGTTYVDTGNVARGTIHLPTVAIRVTVSNVARLSARLYY